MKIGLTHKHLTGNKAQFYFIALISTNLTFSYFQCTALAGTTTQAGPNYKLEGSYVTADIPIRRIAPKAGEIESPIDYKNFPTPNVQSPVPYHKRTTKEECESNSPTNNDKVDIRLFGRVRFQNIGICYSYALADLVTYRLAKLNALTAERVEPLSALNFGITFALESLNNSNSLNDFITSLNRGGVPTKAYALMKRNIGPNGKAWTCKESDFTSDAGSYDYLHTKVDEPLAFQYEHSTMKLMEKIAKYKMQINKENKLTCSNSSSRSLESITFLELSHGEIEYPIQNKCFDKLGQGPISKLVFGDRNFFRLAKTFETDELGFINAIRANFCNYSRAIELPEARMTTEYFGAQTSPNPKMEGQVFFKSIDDNLQIGNPLIINVFSNFLRSREQLGGGGHAMILFDKSWDESSRSCGYHIRNSWGNSCEPYEQSPYVKCDKTNWSLWISEDNLKNNLMSINYLNKQ